MVDVTPGDSGANKGFWREQLRDRFGKFAEMGQDVMFDVQLPGVDGVVQGLGKFIGNVEPTVARIEVSDNSRVPKGVYLVKHSDITAIKAVLPDAYVEKKVKEAAEEKGLNLKKSMTGSEVLKERLRSIARALKEEGRFPIPRLAFTQSVGKDSDVAKGAKLDYKKVFDAEPALQQKYGSAENLWQKVFQYAVDDRTQSPNALAEIPEDMKEINRAYAKHVLGLDPDGLITVYRNAINGKETPEESAIGYASLDRNMAYDYNADRPNNFANGRYEIDVKPDEIFGMLGYSKVEDEYGFALGRELTNIPGRVRRVGDLASPEMQAPWLEDAAKVFRRNQGSSPFRAFNVLGEFDFHPVDPLGQTSEEFFQKYNTSAAELKAKFDELYGEGAYDRYKASGNSVSFQRIRDLFVPLPDGRIGLDGAKLEKLNVTNVNTAEYRDDLFDNTLKMLSVFQELTGQPFMTHKTRDYSPAKQEAPTPLPPILQEELEMVRKIQALGQSPSTLTTEEVDAVERYRGFNKPGEGILYFYEGLNSFLRYKNQDNPRAEQYSNIVKNLDSVLEKFEGLPEDVVVYRGVSGRSKRYQDLKVGDEISDAGYTSTSLSEDVAWGFATRDDAVEDYRGFLIEIRVPKGTKVIEPIAATEPDPEKFFRERAKESEGSALTTTEREFILPRESKFRVIERIDEPEDSFETDTPTRFVLELVPPTSTESDLDQDSPTIYDEFFDGGMVDLRSLRDSSPRVSPYDLDMFSDDQLRALEWYGQAGHRSINKILRSGEPISAEDQKLIDSIDSAIEENGEVFSDSRVFRGDTPSSSSDYYKFLEGLTEGDTVDFPGYFSASNDAQLAFSEFGPGQGGSDDDGSNAHLSSTFFWTIDVPEGAKAMAMPEGLGFGQGAESEVILPRNSKLKILGVKKVEQLDDGGNPTGNYNYFIHAGQQL